ncbi:MAG TPA: hypothetical protein ENI29_02300 [bacterium]|nr:hypothetical protein [bacterium]
MIQNILISKNGILLASQHFGNYHSIDLNRDLISSFFTVIQKFSTAITGTSINFINFEKLVTYFYEDPNDESLLYILITDFDDNPIETNFKMHKIADLFDKKYRQYIKEFKGDISPFQTFGNTLVKMRLEFKNCGGHPTCDNCSRNKNQNSLLSVIKKDDINVDSKFFELKDTKIKLVN